MKVPIDVQRAYRHRRGGSALLLALVLLFDSWSGVSHAATVPTYTSVAYHYTVSYPLTWTRVAVHGANFAVVAADRNAAFSVTVAPGEASLPALADALKLIYPPFGRPDNRPTFGAVSYGFVLGEVTSAFVTGRHGVRSYIYASNFSYEKHLYTFVGVVADVTQPTTGQDYQAIRTVINTFHISG